MMGGACACLLCICMIIDCMQCIKMLLGIFEFNILDEFIQLNM